MTEQSPPGALLAVQVAEIVFQRVKKELFGEALEDAFKRGMRVGEFAGPPPTPQAPDVAAAFDRGRLLGQEEGRQVRIDADTKEATVPFASFEDLRQRFLDSEATIRDLRAEVARTKAQVQTAHEAYLNVATERDGLRDEHAHCAGDFQAVCHDRNKAESKAALETAKARLLARRLEVIRAYLPVPEARPVGPVTDALDDRIDPWSILLPNEPF